MTAAKEAQGACVSAKAIFAESQQAAPLMSTQDCATYLAKSKPWLYEQINKGQIPFLRVGNEYRFEPSAIEAWLRSGSSAGI